MSLRRGKKRLVSAEMSDSGHDPGGFLSGSGCVSETRECAAAAETVVVEVVAVD